MKTGITKLPLHYGKAPSWLFQRMVKLAREIIIFIVSEFSAEEFITRLSDPFWFQSLGCVLGFDWHSSGLTTTTCGALKEAVKDIENDLGLYICGGKGGASRKTPEEIKFYGQFFPSSFPINKLVYASRIAAKVDNNALQDGYHLYHHNFFFTKKGKWAIIQQGMNISLRMARRYHWLSDRVFDFTQEPQSAICCDKKTAPLNLISKKSRKVRNIITQISQNNPEKNMKMINKIIRSLNLPIRHKILISDLKKEYLEKIFLKTYETNPQNFENLLVIKGVGSKTLRALTLLAEIIYGEKPSYEDPVRYSFAYGGKDGIPYPLDKKTYDETIEILAQAIKKAKISFLEKKYALRRLLNY